MISFECAIMMDTDYDEKPPAPPVRLASARDQMSVPVDMRPLPKVPDRDEEKRKNKLKQSKNVKKDKKDSEKPVISPPTNFEHTVHVGFDSVTGEFTGMPPSWAQLLQNSNISKTEQKKNPQAVLDVLNWYDSSKAKGCKYMTMNRTLGNCFVILFHFANINIFTFYLSNCEILSTLWKT